MNLIEPLSRSRPPMPAATGIDRPIGGILVESGRLSSQNIEAILRLQRQLGMRFGEAAVELRLLGEDDVHYALSRQFDFPCLQREDASVSRELMAAYGSTSPAVEQLRALRSQLVLRWSGEEAERKALAIVSPGIGEGRSFIAANLAIVITQLGGRTLLVDADLRSPRQHELFKIGHCAGLSEMLAGRAGEEAIVNIAALSGLFVLPAGAVPPNPQELLSRPGFSGLLHKLGNEFDTLVIDTPAAGEYADAHVIAVHAGAALLLARNNQSSLPGMAQLTHLLQQSGVQLVGCVLNDV